MVWCHLPQRHPIKSFPFKVRFVGCYCLSPTHHPLDANNASSPGSLSPTLSQSDRFTTSKHIIQKFLINNFIIKTFFWKCNSVKHWKIYFNKDPPCACPNGTYILQLKTLFYIKPKILQEVIHCVYKVLEGFCLVFFSLNNLALRKSGSEALTTGGEGRCMTSGFRSPGAADSEVERCVFLHPKNQTGVLLHTPLLRH